MTDTLDRIVIGNIITLSDETPVIEAVGLKDGVIVALGAAENVKKRREHTKKLAKQGLLFDVHRAFMPKLKPQERKRLEENGEWRYKYFLENLKRSKALLKKGPE